MIALVRGIDTVSRWAAYLSTAGIFVLMLVVTWEVISRYVFSSPTSWVEELSRYVLVWAALLAAAHTLSHDEHVAIDVFYGFFTPALRRACRIVGALIGMGLSALVAYYGWISTERLFELGQVSLTSLQTPMFIPKAAPMVAFALLFVQFGAELLKDIFGLRNSDDPAQHQ